MDSRESSIQDLALLEQREMVLRALKRPGLKKFRPSRASATLKKLRGVLIMIFAQVCFFLMMFLVKVVNDEAAVPSFQIQTIRGIIMLVCQLAVMKAKNMKWNIHRRLFPTLTWRALALFLSLSLSYYATTIMGLHQSLTLLYTSPFISSILGALLLGEALGRIDVAAIFTSFAGVFLVMQPAFVFGSPAQAKDTEPEVAGIYYTLPVMAAFFTSISYYLIRKTKNDVDAFTPVIFFSVAATVLSPIFCLFQGWATMSSRILFLCCASGALGWVGQIAMSKALQLEKLCVGSAVGFLQVALSFFADIAYFGVPINSLQIGGAVLIFGGLAVMSYRKLSEETTLKPAKHVADLESPLLEERLYERLG